MNREYPIQCAIVKYLRFRLPSDCIVHHSVNEQVLSSKDRKAAAIATSNAKKAGMVPGYPDITVLNYAEVGPVFFEVKAPGNYPTQNQKDVHERLRKLGYHVAVVRSIDEVQALLDDWHVGTVGALL